MTDNQDYIKPVLPALAKDGWPTLEKGWVWLMLAVVRAIPAC